MSLSTQARIKLAEEYKAAGELPLAVKIVYEGLNVEPDNAELLLYITALHMQSKNYGLTFNILKRLKELLPADPGIEHNLGLSLMNMASFANREDYLDIAEKHLKRALAKAPNLWQSHSGLAQICLSRGEFDAAITHAQKAVELGNGADSTVYQTLGFALLAKGKFAAGFTEIEKHIGNEMRKPRPVNREPYWDGQAASVGSVTFNAGNVLSFGSGRKRIFVQGEQGLGDEISFASVIPDVSKDVDVVLECDPRLEGLFKRSFPGIEIHGTRTSVREAINRDWGGTFDAMCLSGTLLKYYRRKAEDFPRTPFLKPDPERQLQWKALLDTLPGKKVGIAWNGGVPMNFKGRRSMRLDDLKHLLKTPGITWVCLEYRDAQDEINAFCAANPDVKIVRWARATEGEDYDETAALVSQLDGVVSVCTAVVHLCGAIGKRCHVLVPKVPRWFYGEAGKDHPWYASLALYRKGREWPLDEVKHALGSELWPQAEAAD